ncbi:MAG: lipopolysaccharide core heptose(I) kinase RfaP [Thermodesulfobacteriota bacterium]|nr:lipopolysaccharide core heptose(I) kinase RfaP [Thermodesulfobacteriota bacterium]
MVTLPRAWLDRWKGQDIFEQLYALEGEVYRKQQGRTTLRFSFNGKYYFAKTHRGIGWKEIAKNLLQFRLPQLGAQNEWRAIQRLEELNINTTPLVGYGKRGWNPARLQSFVVTEELANTLSLEDFCRDWPMVPPSLVLKRALIRKVARIVRKLHEHGMNHRDLYICHFLLHVSSRRENMDPHSLRLSLIDLHRMQIRHHIPFRWRAKDVAALYFSSMDIGLTKGDVLRFLRVYWNKPLRTILSENKAVLRKVEKRALALYRKHVGKDPMLPL